MNLLSITKIASTRSYQAQNMIDRTQSFLQEALAEHVHLRLRVQREDGEEPPEPGWSKVCDDALLPLAVVTSQPRERVGESVVVQTLQLLDVRVSREGVLQEFNTRSLISVPYVSLQHLEPPASNCVQHRLTILKILDATDLEHGAKIRKHPILACRTHTKLSNTVF